MKTYYDCNDEPISLGDTVKVVSEKAKTNGKVGRVTKSRGSLFRVLFGESNTIVTFKNGKSVKILNESDEDLPSYQELVEEVQELRQTVQKMKQNNNSEQKDDYQPVYYKQMVKDLFISPSGLSDIVSGLSDGFEWDWMEEYWDITPESFITWEQLQSFFRALKAYYDNQQYDEVVSLLRNYGA